MSKNDVREYNIRFYKKGADVVAPEKTGRNGG